MEFLTFKTGETVELRTLDLSGRALDWAVAKALHTVVPGHQQGPKSFLDGISLSADAVRNFSPTKDSALAQALIHQEGVRIEYYESSPKSGWEDYSAIKGDSHYIGATAELAGLRCIVGSKIGQLICVPRDLVRGWKPGD